jgi:hypothetical protein
MMIHIVRGDISLGSAVDGASPEAIGSRQTRRKLGAWLNLSPLTSVRSQPAGFQSTRTQPGGMRRSCGRKRAL